MGSSLRLSSDEKKQPPKEIKYIAILPEYKFKSIQAANLPFDLKHEVKAQEIVGQGKIYREGVSIDQDLLKYLPRIQNADGQWKSDFDEETYVSWMRKIEQRTALCESKRNSKKTIFVLPGQKLEKGTFIPTSGIVSGWHREEKTISVNPGDFSGITQFIEDGFVEEQLKFFEYKDENEKARVARPNLRYVMNFFNGYPIPGYEVIDTLEGEEYGKRLLVEANSLKYIFQMDPRGNFYNYQQPSRPKIVVAQLRDPSNKVILFDGGSELTHGTPLRPEGFNFRKVKIGHEKYGSIYYLWELMETPVFLGGVDADKKEPKQIIVKVERSVEKCFTLEEIQDYFRHNPNSNSMNPEALPGREIDQQIRPKRYAPQPIHLHSISNDDQGCFKNPCVIYPFSSLAGSACGFFGSYGLSYLYGTGATASNTAMTVFGISSSSLFISACTMAGIGLFLLAAYYYLNQGPAAQKRLAVRPNF